MIGTESSCIEGKMGMDRGHCLCTRHIFQPLVCVHLCFGVMSELLRVSISDGYPNEIRNLASRTGTGNSVQSIQLIQNRKESHNLKYDIANGTYYDARGFSELSIFVCPLYLRLLKGRGSGCCVLRQYPSPPQFHKTKPLFYKQ